MCLDVLQPQVLRHFKMWEFPTKDDEAVEYAPQDELRQVSGVHAAERTSQTNGAVDEVQRTMQE